MRRELLERKMMAALDAVATHATGAEKRRAAVEDAIRRALVVVGDDFVVRCRVVTVRSVAEAVLAALLPC